MRVVARLHTLAVHANREVSLEINALGFHRSLELEIMGISFCIMDMFTAAQVKHHFGTRTTGQGYSSLTSLVSIIIVAVKVEEKGLFRESDAFIAVDGAITLISVKVVFRNNRTDVQRLTG